MRLTIAVMIGCLFTSVAGATDAQVVTIDPRTYGYFIGDTIVRDVVVTVPPGRQLRASALPQPGPRDYWLDLVDSSLTTTERRSSTEHRLKLTYQVFYAALEPKRLKIPGFKLYFDGPRVAVTPASAEGALPEGAADNTKSVAPLEFIVSPLREIIPEKTAASDEPPLRPDARATPLGTGRARSGLLASLIAGMGLMTALTYHYSWFPFGKRRRRPFARAARSIAELPDRSDDIRKYDEELIILHRAFDDAYGRRVLSGDIENFFLERPEFIPLQDRVEQFFQASYLAFFAGKKNDARRIVPADAVGFLAHDLARIERRAA